MTVLFGNFHQQRATDAGGEVVKRTHWHVVRKGQAQQEPFYSLPAATNSVRGKYPPDQISFTERRTNHCEICRARSEDTIKKVSGGYKVLSESGGKNLGGPYKSKAQAEKRLRQIEYFKHQK